MLTLLLFCCWHVDVDVNINIWHYTRVAQIVERAGAQACGATRICFLVLVLVPAPEPVHVCVHMRRCHAFRLQIGKQKENCVDLQNSVVETHRIAVNSPTGAIEGCTRYVTVAQSHTHKATGSVAQDQDS